MMKRNCTFRADAGWTARRRANEDGQPVSGSGATDRATVLALLDGYAGVTDVILDGRLRVDGPVDDIARMFQSIETLIDGATRVPMLQQLARDFRADPCRAPVPSGAVTALVEVAPGCHRCPQRRRDGAPRTARLASGQRLTRIGARQ